MIPSRTYERYALAVAAGTVVFAGLTAYLRIQQDGRALLGVAIFAGLTCGISLLTALHATLRRHAAEEAQDVSRLQADDVLFEDGGAHVKARNLRQFERYLVHIAVGILAAAEFVLGFYLFRLAGMEAVLPKADQARVVAAVTLVGGIAIYLFGSYLGGLAFRGKVAVLRALAGELIGLAWLSGLTGGVALLGLTELSNYDGLLTRVLGALLIVRAVEKGLSILMEVYRPRRKGMEEHLVYESRINGLVAQPRSLAANLVETLNYQFGINLSETGIQGIAWMALVVVAFQLVVLGVFSSMVFVNVGEQAVIERWGEPREATLGPGVHAKLPWPVDKVYRRPVDQVQSLTIGPKASETSATALWTDEKATDLPQFITASKSGPAKSGEAAFSLLNVAMTVQFQVENLRDYLYTSTAPRAHLQIIAKQELVRLLSGRDLFDLLGANRYAVNDVLLEQIQKSADLRRLGVRIHYVGVHDMQPPRDVVDAFHEVVASGEDRKRLELIAQGERSKLLTEAGTESLNLVADAKSYRSNRISLSKSEASSYEKLLALYTKNRELYRARAYLERIEKLRNVRKLVLATDLENQVIEIDLKKSKSELFDFAEGK